MFEEMLRNRVKLFLDDIRYPLDVYDYIKNTIYLEAGWDIVRSHNEFVKYITENGIPDLISFDHDLADSHYTPQHLWADYEKSKEWQDAQIHSEKTGYESAKWLVEYCIENNCSLPEYLVHSMNPVGADNIIKCLNNYKI